MIRSPDACSVGCEFVQQKGNFMKKHMAYRIVLPLLAALALPAAAQYTGPGAQAPVQSVAAVAAAKDDAVVDMTGFIVRQLTAGKYLFSDGKEQIRVEIDSEVFPRQPINEKTRVRIRGELEKDFLESPEVDVKLVEVLK